ncbi:nucleotidyltransferase family protein [Microscilla marina]|uniref:Purine catabolism protein PucB n=1 Tax=Microscilla marina ATCC 23134 TaxID=313606 RepID=A1ZVU0_MICM2|nr:nucleotidyltransferase family protein [Microscilla marina]EAY25517.1 purine catabolism protein PucB [Microscilla marina ATCC 23134]
MKTKPQLDIMILAAGKASRMGQAKQLLKLQGQSLLEICLAKATTLPTASVVVVLGAYLAQTQPLVSTFGKGVHAVVNKDWESGMGSSIATGMNKILEINPSAKATMVLLADQPLVSAEKLHEMLDLYQQKAPPIITSAYSGTFGVPAIFERAMFKHLLQLKGKTGAKKVMKQHLDQLTYFDLPMAAFDADTPKDFEQIKAMIMDNGG